MLAVALAVSVNAQQKWSLRQCIDHAIEHNIELKQQRIKVENAEVDLSTSKNSRLPNLNASVSPEVGFGRTPINDNTSITYESLTTFRSSFGVSSSTPLFTGFRISNEIKKKEFDLLSATANLSKARENMELQVASLYLDVLFKKEILKVYKDQYDLTTKQVERTLALVEAGKVPRSQEYDIVSQQAKDELNIIIAQNDLDITLLNLSQALNLQENEGFDIIEPSIDKDEIEENKNSIILPSEIYNIALGIKPHIKVAEYDLESSKKNLGIAKAAYFPTINLNMGYGTSFNNKAQGNFKYQFKNQGNEYIGLSLNIPLFNRFQTRNNVRAARLNIENYELALDNVKLTLYKEIQQAYQSAVAAQAKFTSTEKAFFAAEESYKYAEQRYEIGKSSVFEFNEAQTKLLTSKSEQIQAKYDFLFRAKILDFYRGAEIDIR